MNMTELSSEEVMEVSKMRSYIQSVFKNMPSDWLKLTTHRLDIYNEKWAKKEFIDEFELLYRSDNSELSALSDLPTAYDYIRLGHPLSSILEWFIAKTHQLDAKNVVSFSSQTIPVFSILRKNLLENKSTQIFHLGDLPACFDEESMKSVYGYHFNLKRIHGPTDITAFNGSTILITSKEDLTDFDTQSSVDFIVNTHEDFGSILLVNQPDHESYISEIQHVRRRETIAMTPADSLEVLKTMAEESEESPRNLHSDENKAKVLEWIQKINGTQTEALVGSSGLSIQYAIMMGLIDHAQLHHHEKKINIIIPPNCYGGTNDQARRVAACLDHVSVLDLPVDGGNDMVKSIDQVLNTSAQEDAIPFIIAEIPTNPRVEVPDLHKLKEVLEIKRTTSDGGSAIDPVFILDQTFCPNVHFLGEGKILSSVRAISYSSGSKFPSGGLCTAGYCIGNQQSKELITAIGKHLSICDNEATPLQYEILASQLPSMIERIRAAYQNTRDFVTYIHETLPEAKINFVSEELAKEGFTPSVFSLDLPSKGNDEMEKEKYKRKLNDRLIRMMIEQIPNESKNCVSYGQLKGCYWTIPATSTQGTTKEGDKDYIVRVALSPAMDLDHHKKVFLDFVHTL